MIPGSPDSATSSLALSILPLFGGGGIMGVTLYDHVSHELGCTRLSIITARPRSSQVRAGLTLAPVLGSDADSVDVNPVAADKLEDGQDGKGPPAR